MTIESIAGARQTEPRPAGVRDSERSPEALKKREVEEAVRDVGSEEGVGPSSELRFAIDQDTGKSLIRIVDRVTDEVIAQLPPETAVRAAEVLKSLRPGDYVG